MPAAGNDISWPQCPKGMGVPSRRGYGLPMPKASAKFVVIGLTNGPAFYPNPCLAAQTAWAKAHHMYTATYVMTTHRRTARWPPTGAGDPMWVPASRPGLSNTGYAQARYNLASMGRARLASTFMWLAGICGAMLLTAFAAFLFNIVMTVGSRAPSASSRSRTWTRTSCCRPASARERQAGSPMPQFSIT